MKNLNGRIAPNSAERQGENIADAITKDEEPEEERQEEDPRLSRKR